MSARRTLESSRPPRSVLDEDRSDLLERLASIFRKKSAEALYLVGSYARGKANAWSDLDLIAVLETDTPFPDRPRLFEELDTLGFPVDLLVYTPEEFARMEANPTGFWRTTQRDRVRLV